ncbi:MAG: long-chain fatty acid--CoA ligase [Candidatus Ornithospirochaeta sp.]|nr:long-chain fatty acid--CoA ligase [Candidatus Ornithospirochaeta sp.]
MYRTLAQMFNEVADNHPLEIAQYYKNEKGAFTPKTYVQLQEEVFALSLALRSIGVRRGDNVALFSDNRAEWLALDLALLSIGARDVPRGRDAMEYEIGIIVKEADCSVVIVENAVMLRKVLSALKERIPERIIVIDPASVDHEGAASYQDLLKDGMAILEEKGARDEARHQVMLGGEDDVITIIFTSGTTGNPKGVQLTNRNMVYQLGEIHKIAPFEPGQRWLSVLPVWHSFERIMQYVALNEVNSIAYSKPIGKIMLTDIQRINPAFISSVPRIWETVKSGVYQSLRSKSAIERKLFSFFLAFSKANRKAERLMMGKRERKRKGIRLERAIGVIPYFLTLPFAAIGRNAVFKPVKKKLGTSFIGGVSGGGSLGKDVAEFFDALGIRLLNGYGLTESAPVISVSEFDLGKPGFMKVFEGTEIRIVDTETGKELGKESKGELLVRGPQVMKGYINNGNMTALSIDSEGFLHTGDLAVMDYDGDISIVGRAKDTIVLSGGENIEPVFIEQALCQSEYIESAVVVGQDRKYLSALIVIDRKNTERYLKERGIVYMSRERLEEMEEVRHLIASEIIGAVSSKRGFKSFEEINRFALLGKSFEVGKELSAKQEIKRRIIGEMYREQIESLYK